MDGKENLFCFPYTYFQLKVKYECFFFLSVRVVTSGVTQGSYLGQLCFIWFVNEISRIFRHMRVRVLFYADDIKLFLPVRGFRDCLKIQSE
jgi:hypothetical protein